MTCLFQDSNPRQSVWLHRDPGPFERCSAPQKRADNMREMARAPEDDAHQLFPKSVGPHQRVVEINHNRKGRFGHKRFLFVTAL